MSSLAASIGIVFVAAGDRRQHGPGIFHPARHGTDMVQGFRQREDAIAADPAPGRLQPDAAIGIGREPDRAAGVAAERSVAEAAGRRDSGARGGRARPAILPPGVHRRRHIRMMQRERPLGEL